MSKILRFTTYIFLIIISIGCKEQNQNNSTGLTDTLVMEGLTSTVEIQRDKWGINHIYAKNPQDLFFAQGYAAAKDRLFQFEIWRRQATGTVSEILGERELKRDIGTRLFKYRKDLSEELNHYHKDGEMIINSFTAGVNAFISEIMKTPDSLPLEFKMLGIQPQLWTPSDVISRHQGLLGNIEKELQIGRAVAKVGDKKVKEIAWFHPKDPNLKLDASITEEMLNQDILELYKAYRKPVSFLKSDLVKEYRNSDKSAILINSKKDMDDSLAIGSNNWVINGNLSEDGNTYMANDPHRTVAIPSLRYMAHLVAPGWNVIGGGEPEIPGISIGHNEQGSWGLTVFETDGEDMYVYDLNPENHQQYKYENRYIDMTVIPETIKIKGKADVTVEMLYTQHGPVTYIDVENHKAFAVKCAWLEPGGSPYLASLRMDQATDWDQFREACSYSHIPGENMVWADKQGNIGWQAVGIAPVRPNHSGLVPVPASEKYEWDGYLPIMDKPHKYNPEENFIATANQNLLTEDYRFWNAVGYTWADPSRGNRLNEVLKNSKKLDMEDMRKLQVDYHSITARTLVPYLKPIQFDGDYAEAKEKLQGWNYELNKNSIAAAIYTSWENAIQREADKKFIPKQILGNISHIQLHKIIEWISGPDGKFGAPAEKSRNNFLKTAFEQAIDTLKNNLGEDMNQWQYGQEKLKHTYMEHALSSSTTRDIQNKLDLGPLPRGGNSYTPGSTGGNLRQSSGATFRIIVNTGDWDAAIATNSPGQSGNPESPFYGNLFESWANDEYFPVYYSKKKIDSVTVEKFILRPSEKL
ncbi:penicillin amidase [Flavobacteriaceae bacterium MAR_2010_188]|nr:penicillin amidase [Flavobacteriaceae bacterium MAR_2010_188]